MEDIEKAISENRYNKKETTSNLIISSEESKDNIQTNRDEHENVILTEAISNIIKDNEEIKEENKRDADDDEVDINVVSKTESRNAYLLCGEIKINDTVVSLRDGNLSNIIKEGSEERDEENNRYVVYNEVENKYVRKIELGNDLLTSDKIKINDVSSKKQTYNETRDNDDTVLNKSKAVGFSNYEDGRKIVPENDRESDDSDVIFNNGTIPCQI